MKNTITIIIMIVIPIFFLILILGLVNFFYNPTAIDIGVEEKERRNEPGEYKEIIITITKDGIEPKTIEETSTAVFYIIVNNDTKIHRMVSQFGDIDSGDLKPGDSFKKNFNNFGENILTDQYNPDIKVKITVGTPGEK